MSPSIFKANATQVLPSQLGTGPAESTLQAVRDSVSQGVTANASGGLANGTPVVARQTQVTVAGAANASLLLPPSSNGAKLTIINANSGNTIIVYPQANETINSGANNAGFSLANNKVADFVSPIAGSWYVNLTA